MNIIVNINKNTLANKQPKIYDLGTVTTTIQDLLDNSTVLITNYRTIVIKFIDLDLSEKQAFLNLDDYNDGDKYGLGQSILESDLIYFSSGSPVNSGDFIPLSGTIAGNPVTGNLEFGYNGEIHSIYMNLGTTTGSVGIDEGVSAFLKYSDSTTGYDGLAIMNPDYLNIQFTSPTALGLRGIYDYSANYDDNTYTQKIYVDGLRGKHISKTTTEINAIVTPQSGETYFNTTLNKLCFFNGTIWQQVTSSAM